jgi:SEC-C motif domain protein
MRSRYSAYALAKGSYLNETALTQVDDVNALEKWCREVCWLRLQIWDATQKSVRFTAHSLQQGRWVQLHETSEFVQVAGQWRYAQGRTRVEEAPFPMNGRCPCGSGRKGKHCHGELLSRALSSQ